MSHEHSPVSGSPDASQARDAEPIREIRGAHPRGPSCRLHGRRSQGKTFGRGGTEARSGASGQHALFKSAESRASFIRQTEADVVKLSMAVARRILYRELTIDQGAIAGLVKAALEKLQSDVVARARVHPELEAAVRATIEQSGRRASVEVVADASLDRGGVVVETNRGSLDASIETQLREIELGFADRFRRPSRNGASA